MPCHALGNILLFGSCFHSILTCRQQWRVLRTQRRYCKTKLDFLVKKSFKEFCTFSSSGVNVYKIYSNEKRQKNEIIASSTIFMSYSSLVNNSNQASFLNHLSSWRLSRFCTHPDFPDFFACWPIIE